MTSGHSRIAGSASAPRSRLDRASTPVISTPTSSRPVITHNATTTGPRGLGGPGSGLPMPLPFPSQLAHQRLEILLDVAQVAGEPGRQPVHLLTQASGVDELGRVAVEILAELGGFLPGILLG